MIAPLKPEEIPTYMEWSAKEIERLGAQLHAARMLLHLINGMDWFHKYAPNLIRSRVDKYLLPEEPKP